jgi:6-phosphogluconolactonase
MKNQNNLKVLLHEICNVLEFKHTTEQDKSIMLTGGNSASSLYKLWAQSSLAMSRLKGFKCYLGDERNNVENERDTNLSNIKNNLFVNGSESLVTLFPIKKYELDPIRSAEEYSALLPKSIDLLLLSVGEDGHIASLFPYSPALLEESRLVVPVKGPRPYVNRITITPRVIKSAHTVFVMAFGKKKRKVFNDALKNPKNFLEIPARLVLNRTWFFGDLNE